MKINKILILVALMSLMLTSTALAKTETSISGNNGKETYKYGDSNSNIQCNGISNFTLNSGKVINSVSMSNCSTKNPSESTGCNSLMENNKFEAVCTLGELNQGIDDNSISSSDGNSYSSAGYSTSIAVVPKKYYGNAEGLTLFVDDNFVIKDGRDMRIIDSKPYIKNGSTFVPVRLVSEGLAYDVKWNPERQSVSINKGTDRMELYLGNKIAYVNGKQIHLDSPPEIVEGSTMVPLRFISETLGAKVLWNADNRSVQVK
jgi:hypothetical protein